MTSRSSRHSPCAILFRRKTLFEIIFIAHDSPDRTCDAKTTCPNAPTPISLPQTKSPARTGRLLDNSCSDLNLGLGNLISFTAAATADAYLKARGDCFIEL
mmetsp:Transcript_31805/g.98245  ORF Transcript_31805/g.98245 Transcript_31805/m.98245 type:complete len:101 (-) Transcript_31805:125-427(-)